jgi:hypothetical protein
MQGEVCNGAQIDQQRVMQQMLQRLPKPDTKKSAFDLPCSAVTHVTSRSVGSDKVLQRLERVWSVRFRMRVSGDRKLCAGGGGGECPGYPCILVSEKIILARRGP